MKKLQILSLTALLIVPSCTSAPSEETKVTIEKHANLYRTVLSATEAQQLGIKQQDYYKLGEVDYRVVEGEEMIPYVTMNQYVNFLSPLFKDTVKSIYQPGSDKISWGVSNKDNPVFMISINFTNSTITTAGSLSDVFVTSTPTDPSTYYKGMKMNAEVLNRNQIQPGKIDNYKGFDIDAIKVNNDYYMPLGLIDSEVSKYSGFAVYNAFNEFYLVSNSNTAALTDTKFYESTSAGAEEYVTPLHRAKKNAIEIVKNTFTRDEVTYPIMPLYLREYNRNLLAYFFDSQYGLKYVRGVKSMKEYLQNSKYWEQLISEDALERGDAFSEFIGMLEDGHTSTRTYNDFVWGESKARVFGPLWQERVKLRSDLLEARKEAYTKYDYLHASSEEEKQEILKEGYEPDQYAVRYSDDNTMAFFNFDGFVFSVNDEDPEKYKNDTFTYFVRQFSNLKEGVKNVVIDMSTNGGGIVIALMKILALISKENEAHLGFYNQSMNIQQLYTFSVDTNGDGQYDKEDVYGDDYNIYILTSSFSFSCGNAYPFLAQREGFAKIMGMRSGGGECTVETCLLPSGQFIGHSSMTRIGDYQPVMNGTEIDHYDFYGAEGGSPVDEGYAVNYFDYFNFNYLAELTKA